MDDQVDTRASVLTGGLRSDVAELLNPDFEELEGFAVEEGRLRKMDGLKPINTIAFARRITGVGTWRDKA